MKIKTGIVYVVYAVSDSISILYYHTHLLKAIFGNLIKVLSKSHFNSPKNLDFGVSLSVIANVIMNSGEAFVKAVADTIDKEFGNVKIAFDITCVTISLVLSLLFFNFTIVDTREETIISAFFTGVVVKFFNRRLARPLNAVLTSN